jgi:alkylation response protein AidB-like acyl-CoA dehydrogenase
MGASTEELAQVRTAVRDLVEEWLAAGRFAPACDSWLRRYDLEFSQALGARGLIGISWPREYGGSERSGVARLVVTEELLRAGAPVAAHWIADRQIGPSILRHGSDAAKKAYLPGIARGEVTFCLGMSETESGSDLASVRTTATRSADGWVITGRKIWTSQAHRSTHAYVLARTSTGESKHEGLSEFIVDMSHPGVDVRPIYDLRGEHHFNEVTFDAVVVPDDHVLGTIGGGWGQVTDQLSLERGGIERVMSTYPLLDATVTELGERGIGADPAPTGEILARLAVLRAMAFDVATAIDAGVAPIQEAAMLKDLGTTFEREVNEYARDQLDVEPDPQVPGAAGLLAQGILAAPGFTIRGGTTEVLRTIVARGISGRLRELGRGGEEERRELRAMVDDVLDGRGGDPGDELPDAWPLLVELGWPRVAIEEDDGGVGGDLSHLGVIVAGLGRHSVSVPLAECAVAARALVAAGQPAPPVDRVLTIATEGARLRRDADGLHLDGVLTRVPWGRYAEELLVCAAGGDGDGAFGEVVVRVPARQLAWRHGTNLAAEPRDEATLDSLDVAPEAVLDVSADAVRTELALLRAVAATGALETALATTAEHVTTRIQFGKPLIAFQAVAGLVAVLASEHESARLAADRALAAVRDGGAGAWRRVAAARVVTGRAATEGARIAHQLHAAMGVTREHPLHLSTRRLWSWRDEVGTQRSWARRLGGWALATDGETRWRWLTEQSDPHIPDGPAAVRDVEKEQR